MVGGRHDITGQLREMRLGFLMLEWFMRQELWGAQGAGWSAGGRVMAEGWGLLWTVRQALS